MRPKRAHKLFLLSVGGCKSHPCNPPPTHPPSSSHYHIGQGLLIVPRQGAENGERKGIMTARGEKRGSGRKEGQTGYYEGEGEG